MRAYARVHACVFAPDVLDYRSGCPKIMKHQTFLDMPPSKLSAGRLRYCILTARIALRNRDVKNNTISSVPSTELRYGKSPKFRSRIVRIEIREYKQAVCKTPLKLDREQRKR